MLLKSTSADELRFTGGSCIVSIAARTVSR